MVSRSVGWPEGALDPLVASVKSCIAPILRYKYWMCIFCKFNSALDLDCPRCGPTQPYVAAWNC